MSVKEKGRDEIEWMEIFHRNSFGFDRREGERQEGEEENHLV